MHVQLPEGGHDLVAIRPLVPGPQVHGDSLHHLPRGEGVRVERVLHLGEAPQAHVHDEVEAPPGLLLVEDAQEELQERPDVARGGGRQGRLGDPCPRSGVPRLASHPQKLPQEDRLLPPLRAAQGLADSGCLGRGRGRPPLLGLGRGRPPLLGLGRGLVGLEL